MSIADEYLKSLDRWRADRDDFMANHYASPLADDDIQGFEGLRYYEPDLSVVFSVALEAAETRVEIESSAGGVSAYSGAGVVVVPFAHGPVKMQVLRAEDDDLFVPFRDKTSGVTTYDGGRYIAVERIENSATFIVDFNKATNPYCAYDPEFSCPLPPPENRLGFAVEAGELNYPSAPLRNSSVV